MKQPQASRQRRIIWSLIRIGGGLVVALSGQLIDIRLQNIGPGEYSAPPGDLLCRDSLAKRQPGDSFKMYAEPPGPSALLASRRARVRGLHSDAPEIWYAR
jgi:hypothetical protein